MCCWILYRFQLVCSRTTEYPIFSNVTPAERVDNFQMIALLRDLIWEFLNFPLHSCRLAPRQGNQFEEVAPAWGKNLFTPTAHSHAFMCLLSLCYLSERTIQFLIRLFSSATVPSTQRNMSFILVASILDCCWSRLDFAAGKCMILGRRIGNVFGERVWGDHLKVTLLDMNFSIVVNQENLTTVWAMFCQW